MKMKNVNDDGYNNNYDDDYDENDDGLRLR